MKDPRQGNAKFYDLDETPLPDVPFYLSEITAGSAVLELGCGTGRTLIPIAGRCRHITGIDYSQDMVERCKAKLPPTLAGKCTVQVGDITLLDLHRKFDWIIAPYRVLQALETDQEVDGFFTTVKKHLAPGGHCILNVFKPYQPKEELVRDWPKPQELHRWEKILPDGSRIAHSEFYERVSREPLVLFPHLIYRQYADGELVDEFKQSIKMRCYYPDEFLHRIESYGFTIVDTWGGYQGEKYGEGKELVVKFRN